MTGEKPIAIKVYPGDNNTRAIEFGGIDQRVMAANWALAVCVRVSIHQPGGAGFSPASENMSGEEKETRGVSNDFFDRTNCSAT